MKGVILLFSIDKQSHTPIYEQLIDQIERFILIGYLKPNELIPSVRSLSTDLLINPNTIQKAYNYLENMQITYTLPGVGRFVSEKALSVLSCNNSVKLTRFKDEIVEFALSNIQKEVIHSIVESAYEQARQNKEKRELYDKNTESDQKI